MNLNTIDLTCNKCRLNRFTVLKPPENTPENSLYFACPECVRNIGRNKSWSVICEEQDQIDKECPYS